MWNVINTMVAQMSDGGSKWWYVYTKSLLKSTIICIVCLIVHDETIIYKIEAVRTCLKGVRYHLLDWKQQTH